MVIALCFPCLCLHIIVQLNIHLSTVKSTHILFIIMMLYISCNDNRYISYSVMPLYIIYFIYITIYVFIKMKVLVIFYYYYPLIVFLGLILYADLFIFLLNSFLFVLSIKYLLYPFFLLQFYYFFNSLFRCVTLYNT